MPGSVTPQSEVSSAGQPRTKEMLVDRDERVGQELTMALPNERQPWKALTTHHGKVRDLHLRDVFSKNSARGERLTASCPRKPFN
jgi:hypothetical protein